ncbi:MAG: hypothetical protein ABR616_01720 [Dermatophilaceae bacterium]
MHANAGEPVRTARLLVLLATTAVLAGCGATTSPEESSSPYDDAAELRGDRMVAEPSTMQPGSLIELSFPEETGRGLGFVLEEEVDGGWALRYFLTSAVSDGGPNEPSWVPAEDGEAGWDDVGINGPGPDVIEIPDTATAGAYRVCTANARENYCAQLSVANN